jgi:hypothetical protein
MNTGTPGRTKKKCGECKSKRRLKDPRSSQPIDRGRYQLNSDQAITSGPAEIVATSAAAFALRARRIAR